jgi:hypothetical protein
MVFFCVLQVSSDLLVGSEVLVIPAAESPNSSMIILDDRYIQHLFRQDIDKLISHLPFVLQINFKHVAVTAASRENAKSMLTLEGGSALHPGLHLEFWSALSTLLTSSTPPPEK